MSVSVQIRDKEKRATTSISHQTTFAALRTAFSQELATPVDQTDILVMSKASGERVLIANDQDLRNALYSLDGENSTEIVTLSSQSSADPKGKGPATSAPDIPQLQQLFTEFVAQLQEAASGSGRASGLYPTLSKLMQAAEDAANLAITTSPAQNERIEFEVKRRVERFVDNLMRSKGPPIHSFPPPPPPHFPPMFGRMPPPQPFPPMDPSQFGRHGRHRHKKMMRMMETLPHSGLHPGIPPWLPASMQHQPANMQQPSDFYQSPAMFNRMPSTASSIDPQMPQRGDDDRSSSSSTSGPPHPPHHPPPPHDGPPHHGKHRHRGRHHR